MSCSQSARHEISEVTALPSPAADGRCLQTHVTINVQLFMMDDIADHHTEVRMEHADRRGDTDGFTHGTV